MKSIDLAPYKHYMRQLGGEISATKATAGLRNAE